MRRDTHRAVYFYARHVTIFVWSCGGLIFALLLPLYICASHETSVRLSLSLPVPFRSCDLVSIRNAYSSEILQEFPGMSFCHMYHQLLLLNLSGVSTGPKRIEVKWSKCKTRKQQRYYSIERLSHSFFIMKNR